MLSAIIAPLSWAPHAIAYTDRLLPDLRPQSQQGWGEGLEAAAAWLNQHPLGDQLTVASWYSSILDTYFDGTALRLASRDEYRVSHIITYRNMEGRAADTLASDVLDELKGQEPVHTVMIKGTPYAWIYETDNVGMYIRHLGELIAGQEFGQTIIPQTDSWSSVDIAFATFDRDNTAPVILSIYADTATQQPLRRVTIDPANIINNEWTTVAFPVISEAANNEFYLALTSPTAAAGNAVTVRYTDHDAIPGALFVMREPVATGADRASFKKTGDLGVRVTPLSTLE